MAEPKYLAYGSINPFYLAEQEEKRYKEQQQEYDKLLEQNHRELKEAIADFLKYIYNESINTAQQPMVKFTNEYEEKFNFVKDHSGSEEDKALAMKIVGLN